MLFRSRYRRRHSASSLQKPPEQAAWRLGRGGGAGERIVQLPPRQGAGNLFAWLPPLPPLAAIPAAHSGGGGSGANDALRRQPTAGECLARPPSRLCTLSPSGGRPTPPTRPRRGCIPLLRALRTYGNGAGGGERTSPAASPQRLWWWLAAPSSVLFGASVNSTAGCFHGQYSSPASGHVATASHAAMRRRGGRLRSSALWLGVPGRFLRRSPPPRRGRRRVVAAGTSAAAVAAAAAPWPSLPQRGRRFGLPKRPGTQRWCLTTACRGAPPLQRGAS